MGAWISLTLGSRSKSTGRSRKPCTLKREVQFFEMNSRVKDPGLGQTRSEVSGGVGGGPAADS